MKRFLLAILIIFCSSIWAANENPLCEGEMLPNAQRVVRLVTMSLESRDLLASDVEFMLNDPQRLQNPYLRISRDIKNISYRQKLIRILPKLTPVEIAQTRTAILNLMSVNAQNEAVAHEARRETQIVFAPRKIVFDEPPRLKDDKFTYWQNSAIGQEQLVSYNANDARLQFFDPVDGKILEERILIPSLKRKKDLSHPSMMENGHVVVLTTDLYSTEISVHEIDQNKTGITSHLPGSLTSPRILKGENGSIFVIASSEHEIFTFRVDSALKVHLHSSHKFDPGPHRGSRFKFDVAVSQEGRMIVVAADQNTVQIFDPIHRGAVRTFIVPGILSRFRPIFAPSGEYAVALERHSFYSNDTQIWFITSVSESPLKTKANSYTENAIEWFVTKEGRLFFAIGIPEQEKKGPLRQLFSAPADSPGVLVFEPLVHRSGVASKFLYRIMPSSGVIKPTYSLQLDHVEGVPSFYESADGKLFVTMASCQPENRDHCDLNIFEPAVGTTPIHKFSISKIDYDARTKIFHDPSLDQFLFKIGGNENSEILAGTFDKASSILKLKYIHFGIPFKHSNGHAYITGWTNSTNQLQLYRLTSSGGEQP